MFRKVLMTLAAGLLTVPAAHAHSIGIFVDPEAAACATVQVGETPWIDLHVVAVLEGPVTQLTGAQFRITGVPSGWNASNAIWVPDATTTISIGHPLFPTPAHPAVAGVNVAFNWCQIAPRVRLGRIVLLGAPTPAEVHLQVEGFELAASDPHCPFIVNCQVNYGLECVTGGGIVLNGAAAPNCPTAVTPSSWAGVKSLYRRD